MSRGRIRSRLGVGLLLIPILAVAYPFLRSVPSLYIWMVRRRIPRLYSELKLIETDAIADTDSAALRRLEERANRLRVPAALTPELYTLRAHIAMVHNRTMLPKVSR